MFETPEQFRGRIGRIEIGRSYELSSRRDTIGHFVLSVVVLAILVGVPLWLLWPVFLPVLIGLAVFTVYSALAYFVRVYPNHDNLRERFFEYRLSDNVNRSLLALVILLAPGRFISVGIIDGVRLLVSGRMPHEPPTSDWK